MAETIKVLCLYCHGKGCPGHPYLGLGGCDGSGYVEITVQEAEKELLTRQINKLRGG